MNTLHFLSDSALLSATRDLAKQERDVTTRVLRHLREVERRRLFSALGYSSLFDYAVKDLLYCEASAQRRIEAMRLLKELPAIESKLESGELSLSVVSQEQKFFRQEAKAENPLTSQQKQQILGQLEGKSARQAERELLAQSSRPLELKPESVRPLTETHSELKLVVSAEMLNDLEKLRGLLGHSHPHLSLSELVALLAKRALASLDPTREPKRLVSAPEVKGAPVPQGHHTREVQVRDPRETPKACDPSDVPEPGGAVPVSDPPPTKPSPPESRRGRSNAALKRAVWRRDGGRCVRCGSLHRLQIDHKIPRARGGATTIENLRLLCFHCNQHQADLSLGRKHMEKFRHRT